MRNGIVPVYRPLAAFDHWWGVLAQLGRTSTRGCGGTQRRLQGLDGQGDTGGAGRSPHGKRIHGILLPALGLALAACSASSTPADAPPADENAGAGDGGGPIGADGGAEDALPCEAIGYGAEGAACDSQAGCNRCMSGLVCVASGAGTPTCVAPCAGGSWCAEGVCCVVNGATFCLPDAACKGKRIDPPPEPAVDAPQESGP